MSHSPNLPGSPERPAPALPAHLDDVSRRRFLQLMGASLALGGLGACTRQPRETIVPYVRQPEELVPGRPLFFATGFLRAGVATGILVESHMGRPTKVEGNPLHPDSLGGTDAAAQAHVLGLYDPDRSQTITHLGRIRSWTSFVESMGVLMAAKRATQGAGLRILTETLTSPTLGAEIGRLLRELPAAKWHQYEPAGADAARAGARLAFGEDASTYYRIENADVIVSLDADFLGCGPGSLRYVREFSRRRRLGEEANRSMNRLYAVECGTTTTGAMADHRLALRASEIEDFARLLAARLGVPGDSGAGARLGERHGAWIEALARDLERHRGASVVIPGSEQPPVVHALAHAINHTLETVGRTVIHTAPLDAVPMDQLASITELAADIDAGSVDMLLILGANPVFTAPADLDFAKRLEKVALRAHLGLHADETAELCHWHVPEAHPLESWGDARGYDGSVTIQQPLIEPLYAGKTAIEMVTALHGRADASPYDLLREHWKREWASGDFEATWRRSVHDGIVAGSAFPEKPVSLRGGQFARYATSAEPPAEYGETAPIEIVFRPDPTIHDGRFANNAWLQELPKPILGLTWENTAIVSPSTAARLGVASEDVVELALDGRVVEAPVWVQPGCADGSVLVHLGYGRWRGGALANGIGFNAYRLRTSGRPWFAAGLDVRKTGRRSALANAQPHHHMEGRPIVRQATLHHFEEHPEFAKHMAHEPRPDETLYAPHPYDGYAWAMSIDLSACTGCGGCTIACQAENNISVVGKTEVIRGREMHWIRVDHYFEGEGDAAEFLHQPVPCMHCENAPCEIVCPTTATAHSSEGLNDMVYNRCVGTKYCSNNCPYKVRRFNFFEYADWRTESLKGLRNPDVSVRSRGVMEKCTYCVQRINGARIDAEREGRRIADGEIRTACQQACPADAIVFGDKNDAESRVSKRRANPRTYDLLGELNTRPRTSYLARIRNPNPEIGGPGLAEHHG